MPPKRATQAKRPRKSPPPIPENEASDSVSDSGASDSDQPPAKRQKGQKADQTKILSIEGEKRLWTEAEPARSLLKAKSGKNDLKSDGQPLGFTFKVGFDRTLPPLLELSDIYDDMSEKIFPKLSQFFDKIGSRPLRVATMCSGTESPIMFLNHLSRYTNNYGRSSEALGFESYSLNYDHVFAIEIVDFKQAYIKTNFEPKVIFQDIRDLNESNLVDGVLSATTVYGNKVEVEGNVDLLIIGSSCVDFSNLNRHKKSVEKGGESGDTFTSAVFYCKTHRPSICILENVLSGPFLQEKVNEVNYKQPNKKGNGKDAFDEYFRKIGYYTMFANLDSKQFYIPQTRQRGYMVCVYSGKPEVTREELEEWRKTIGAKWLSALAKLERPASVPFDAFMLEESDPRIVRAASETLPPRSSAEWNKCYLRHQEMRHVEGYGNLHPITDLLKGGSTTLPDNFTPAMANLGERVSDLHDISHLRAAVRGYDQNYQSRVIDVSQNIDMQAIDTAKSGVIGCITPSGMPVSTTRCGLLVPVETWKGQGLDIDRLELRRLSPKELKDMAGNAMTSTVVGAVIGASLSIFFEDLQPGDKIPLPVDTEMGFVPQETHGLIEKLTDPFSHLKISRQSAISRAKTTMRRCLCEKQDAIVKQPLQICNTCGHTTHVKCGKKPKHAYIAMSHEVQTGREHPSVFVEFLRGSLPKAIKLHHDLDRFSKVNKSEIDKNTWDLINSTVVNALNSQLSIQKVDRGKVWKVIYCSLHARLIFEISESEVSWTLYAEPDKQLAGTDPIRKHLLHPIARMEVSDEDIMEGYWKFWASQIKVLDGTMQSLGDWVPSWKNSLGLVDNSSDFVPSGYRLTIPEWDAKAYGCDITGTYKLSSECGMAMHSLHVHQQPKDGSAPMYFFLDHDPIENPKYNKFVFSTDLERHSWPEKRISVATMGNLWRQPEMKTSEGVDHSEQVDVKVGGKWLPIKLGFDKSIHNFVENRQLPPNPHINKVDYGCDTSHTALLCTSEIPEDAIPAHTVKDAWQKLNLMNEKDMLRPFSWLISDGKVLPGYTENDHKWHPINSDDHLCDRCAPVAPDMLWKYSQADDLQIPFEDPEQADNYEKSLKHVPSAIEAHYYFGSKDMKLGLKVGINPVTLMHQAQAILGRNFGKSDLSSISLSWRLITDEVTQVEPHKARLRLKSTEDLVPNLEFPESVKLLPRPEQLQEVQWMVNQEDHPPHFETEEVEEAQIRGLGYRLEGKATKEATLRGGISASRVGFGKTATSCWLIAAQAEKDIARVKDQKKQHKHGAIPLKATIILTPDQLTRQWCDELLKFIGVNAIVIENIQQFNKMSIEDWENATVIILNWCLFQSDYYLLKIAQFAGLVEPDKKRSPRALKTWYAHARNEIGQSMENLTKDPQGFAEYIDEKLEASQKATESQVIPVPSKRVRGAAYMAQKTKSEKEKTTSKKAKTDEAEENGTKVKNVPLSYKIDGDDFRKTTGLPIEAFTFARKIVDEFTYLGLLGPQLEAVLLGLKCHCSWALSGTPELGTLQDIKNIVKWVGLDVGRSSLASMTSDQIKTEQRDFTSVELFKSRLSVPSNAHKRRDAEVAQNICDLFIRQNSPKIPEIKYSQHFVEIRQLPAERAKYLEAISFFSSRDFYFNVVKKAASSSNKNLQLTEIQEVIGQSTDCEAALIMRAGFDSSREGLLEHLEDCRHDLTHAISNARYTDYDEGFARFEHEARKANWVRRHHECQPSTRYQNWRSQVDANTSGDQEVSTALVEMLEEVDASSTFEDWKLFWDAPDADMSPLDKDLPEWKQLTKFPQGQSENKQARNISAKENVLRETISTLSVIGQQLVTKKRVARLFENILFLQHCAEDCLIPCEGKDCDCLLNPKDCIISISCGHVLCEKKCMKFGVSACSVDGCDAVIKLCDKTSIDYLGRARSAGISDLFNGSKLEVLTNLVKDLETHQPITKTSGGILIFVQFDYLSEAIIEALKAQNVGVTSLCSNEEKKKKGSTARILNEWQTGKDGNQVLLLPMGGAAAAGSNLTRANHLIFFSPYHIKGSNSQALYEDQRQQATGRSIRHGQRKIVHIYDLLSTNTIDVDIIEMRSKKILTRVEDSQEIKPYPSFMPSNLQLVAPTGNKKSGRFTSVASELVYPEGGFDED